MQYHHTQTSPLYLILIGVGLAIVFGGWAIPDSTTRSIVLGSGVVMLLLAVSFRHLAVRDEGERLLICFGPLPLFRRRLPYAEIESVQRSRSTVLDGWGIHMSAGGGWVWNLWGFDCVDVYRKNRSRLRIGTDDPEGLESFLKQQIEADSK